MSKQSEKHDGMFRRDRRDFLRFGSVAVLGITTTAVAENASRGMVEAFIAEPLPLLGVGYCNPGSAQPSRLIAAEHLSAGDSHFHRTPVRLRISGFHRAEQHRNQPMSVGLNVHYSDEARFMAWHSAVRGSLRLVSSPIKMLVPVDDERGLTLSVDSLRARSSVARRVLQDDEPRLDESRLTLGFSSSDARAKLRRGTYVVAFRESSRDAKPDWSSLRYDPSSADSLLREATLTGSRPAPFSYVILTTDYGDKA
jgi:hypothetical protein